MSDTIRKQIISAIETRLAIVRTANGFNAECGATVELAKKNLGEKACPFLVVWPGDEQSSREYGADNHLMELQVDGVALFGSSDPSDVIEDIFADIVEALCGAQLSLDFDSGSSEIEVGDTVEGATTETTAYVGAVSVASGSWAGGDAAGTLTLRRKTGDGFADDENLDISGGDANAATVDGTATLSKPTTLSTGGLAEDIEYAGGGAFDYPEAGEKMVGVSVVFAVSYKTKAGNPYSQP